MNNPCREIINPTKKLQKFNYFLVLILIIFIILFILDTLYIKADKSYYNFFLSFILLEIIITKYYIFVKIFSFMIILSLMNNIMYLGLFFQNNNSIKENKLKLFYFFNSIFAHLISIYVLFQSYKEMKAIFIEEYEASTTVSENGVELKDYKNNTNEK